MADAEAPSALTRERGTRVLCPIHQPPQPSNDADGSEHSTFPVGGCQGNEVFNTAIATDLAGCAFGAYHQPEGDVEVIRTSLPPTPNPRRPPVLNRPSGCIGAQSASTSCILPC